MVFRNWCQIKLSAQFSRHPSFSKFQRNSAKRMPRPTNWWSGCAGFGGMELVFHQFSSVDHAMPCLVDMDRAWPCGKEALVASPRRMRSFYLSSGNEPLQVPFGTMSSMNDESQCTRWSLDPCWMLGKVSQIQSWRTPKMARNFRRFWQIHNIPLRFRCKRMTKK